MEKELKEDTSKVKLKHEPCLCLHFLLLVPSYIFHTLCRPADPPMSHQSDPE